MPNKILRIFANTIPILIMVGLIPLVENDYLLTLIYIVIIGGSFFIKYQKNEHIVLIAGLILMTLFEYLFVITGVETFNRQSLFGLMPFWLPVLWAYGFVEIKRSVIILSS